jgi:hypothetical protein
MSIQGFWGLACEPEKTYSQLVTAPFRVAMVKRTKKNVPSLFILTAITGFSY